MLALDLPEAIHQVADYLRPFAAERGASRELAGAALDREFTSAFGLTELRETIQNRYTIQPGLGLIDVLTLPGLERQRQTWRAAARQGDPARLRRAFTESAYEYVLVNAPSLLEQSDEDAGAIFRSIATVCDVAVVCFSHREASIREAVRIGESLRRRAPGGIQIVPVGLDIAAGQQDVAGVAAFAGLLATNPRPGRVLALPEFSTPVPVLAALLDEPELVAAHSALAAALTAGAVTGLGLLSQPMLDRYRRATGFTAGVPPRFLIAYTPADRLWADWLAANLRAGGAEVGTVRADAAWLDGPEQVELIVLGSQAFSASGERREAGELADRAAACTEVVVDGSALSLPGATALRLDGLEPHDAAVRLRSFFGLARPVSESVPSAGGIARHPDEEPGLTNLPPARPQHIGRAEALEELRDRLLSGPGPVRVGGGPGSGKTALAREYAHRFANAYDVVWWISAHDRESALAGLVTLCQKLRAKAPVDVPGPLRLPTSELVTPKWLLIFDDGDSPEAYAGLLPPPGRCHVIVTAAADGDIEVAPFATAETTVFMQQRLPWLTDAKQLAELAGALGHRPLAMELSAAWLTEVLTTSAINPESTSAETRAAVGKHIDQLGSRAPGSDAVAAVLDVVTAGLRDSQTGRMTLLLARFCSLLSPEGISLALLRSKEVRQELIKAGGQDAARLAVDAAELDVFLARGARLGLFRVDWGLARTLTFERVIRQLLRDSLPHGFDTLLRGHVLAALAAYSPTEQELDQPHARARFAELNRHIMSAGAQQSDDPMVRQWLVNQAKYLYRTGEPDIWEVAVEPTREGYERWLAAHSESDPYVCMLASQLANLYRELGRYEEALQLDSRALEVQRLHQGRAHYRSLLAARGLSADLRALGRLADAVVEDTATLHGLQRAFGEDHPQTLDAENNLAAAQFHAGDIDAACQSGQAHCDRRARLFGRDDPRNWLALANLGVYQRAMGRFEDSIATLIRAHGLAAALRPEPKQARPAVSWQWSISERLASSRAATTAKSRNGEALTAFRDLLGDRHPQVVACKLSYANAQRQVGEFEHAVTGITECIEVLNTADGHAHDVAICRVMLALALVGAGHAGEAVLPIQEGTRALTAHVGPFHPLSLAAGVDLAVVLAVAGRAEEALTAAREASEACTDFLPRMHYYRDIAASNLRHLGTGGDDLGGLRTLDLDISMP
ncbi:MULTISPECIES: FxSxx-COOH system tetratricopeptide repeat protein [unclassified Amycolatopsis]|uniref:FxSxx-COOH system tetratricopeptide repeat protein n=1 Tax=unclassified Amycolatopsis TaxID=2618356 RepID=UPI002875719D|nr:MULTISPECIES: FxSxx-COOH system tetratricopeptide repeat protein [unclassified Amycolatopsis]MDS0135343.1 tetratricopeptide repeat protein [Amycolatopsis sp. 505]MDS0140966.1 tetratricopeptide repeat protein [Amycolatopsis sp. CM201R]